MKVAHLLTFIDTKTKWRLALIMKGSVKKRGKTYQYVVDVGIDPFTGKRK